LDKLRQIRDVETPHQKAIYIDEALNLAIDGMKIATPYKDEHKYGEVERQRV